MEDDQKILSEYEDIIIGYFQVLDKVWKFICLFDTIVMHFYDHNNGYFIER